MPVEHKCGIRLCQNVAYPGREHRSIRFTMEEVVIGSDGVAIRKTGGLVDLSFVIEMCPDCITAEYYSMLGLAVPNKTFDHGANQFPISTPLLAKPVEEKTTVVVTSNGERVDPTKPIEKESYHSMAEVEREEKKKVQTEKIKEARKNGKDAK